MFGFLPDWVGDTLTIIAVVLGTPGIILWALNRKQANRKLEVEEGGLTVSQFNAALPAYKDLLDRADTAANDAREDARSAKREVNILERKLARAIRLLMSIIQRANIQLTPEEEKELSELEHIISN